MEVSVEVHKIIICTIYSTYNNGEVVISQRNDQGC